MPAATSEEGKVLSERWRKTAVNRKVILAVVAVAILLLAVATGYAYHQSSDMNSEISHLQSQNLALDNATSVQEAEISELQGKLLLSENSTSQLAKAVHDVTAIVDLNRSIILMNDSTVSQNGGNISDPGFTFWSNFTALDYAGYLVLTIHSSNASDCLLEASWSGHGANFMQAWQFGSAIQQQGQDSLVTPGSAVIPVLPTSSLQIGVVNLAAGASVENISITYYF